MVLSGISQKIAAFDERSMLSVLSFRRPILIQIFRAFTFTGMSYAYLAVAGVLQVLTYFDLSILMEQSLFLRALLSPLLAWGAGTLLKRLFSRARPFEKLDGYLAHGPIPTCRSFPSSHAAASAALFFALLIVSHPLAWIVGVWTFLVSFSRYYLGVHFPSDIIGGILLGFACGFLQLFLVY